MAQQNTFIEQLKTIVGQLRDQEHETLENLAARGKENIYIHYIFKECTIPRQSSFP